MHTGYQIKKKTNFCCTLSGAVIANLIPTLKNKMHKTKQIKPFHFYSIFIPSPIICLKLIRIISNKTYFRSLKTVCFFCCFGLGFSYVQLTLLTSSSKLFNTINFLLFPGVLFSLTLVRSTLLKAFEKKLILLLTICIQS